MKSFERIYVDIKHHSRSKGSFGHKGEGNHGRSRSFHIYVREVKRMGHVFV